MELTTITKSFSLNKTGFDKKGILEHLKKNPKETAIIDVLALATGFKDVENKRDPSKASVRFLGQFEVVNRMTGEEITAAEAYFPGMIESYLKGLLEGNDGAIRLGFQVTVLTDDKSPTGYKFGMKLLTDKAKANDPFNELREAFPKREKLIARK